MPNNRNNMEDIPVSDQLDKRVDQTLDLIRKKRRNKTIRKMTAGLGSAAAVFAVVLALGETNPALASKLPLIGHLFEQVEQEVSYKGDYSKDAIQLVTEEEEEAKAADDEAAENGDTQTADGEAAANGDTQTEEAEAAANGIVQTVEAEAAENPYIQTANGVTVTVSEISYTRAAVYLAMSIESEEPFPEDFIRTKNMEDYALDYDRLELESTGTIPGVDQSGFFLYYLEGQFEDANTFAGIARIDLTSITKYPTEEELEEAGLQEMNESIFEEGISDEEVWQRMEEYSLQLKEAFPDMGEVVELPDEFTLELDISKIWGELQTGEMVPGTLPDGEEVETFVADRKEYEGPWEFSFDVKLDDTKLQTVEVNGANEAGEGIAEVVKTPYEINVTPTIPADRLAGDYFVAVCDADGDLLDYQGSSAETYQTYGRNTDTVYVYLCDYVEYMDELKGYYWSEDYEEKKAEKTFAQYLDEHALYGAEVSFTE